MDVFSKEQMNNALLGMYVGTQGPKTLRKCIIDQLFTYQMWRNEETIRQHLDADMVLLVFPAGQSVLSLDDLDDSVVPDIGSLAFGLTNIDKLRYSIQVLLEGPTFHKYLQSRETQFRKKNGRKKLLSKIMFAKLYPESGHPSIFDLDITVLCFILFEGMDFRPISDFHKLPLESVLTEADDMLRIKICRNFLVHQPVAEICDEDFDAYWECLTGAFVRLLKSPCFRRESERLKSLRLPDDKIDQFKAMIQGWRMDDQDERRKQLDQMTDIVTQTGLHTESVIKATGTQIVENQNENHEEIVNLLKQNNSNRRKVQNKELRKSYPVHICGYDKFQLVCEFMRKHGIRYTLPTASSTDTSHQSDSSSSPKSSDNELIQFEIDREDDVDEISLNLHQYSPRHCIDSECRASDATSNILNSSSDSATNASMVADVRQKKQSKRPSREKSRSTQETRCCPRPGNAICTGAKMRLSSTKGGMYSADSTGYNTDLLTLISSVDGNTTSDTLSQVARPEESLSIHRERTQLPRTEEEQCFNSSEQTHVLPNVTDDGYYSNGYISSLDRGSSSIRDQFTGLPKLQDYSTTGSFADGKEQTHALPNVTDDGYYSNISSLDRGSSSIQYQFTGLPKLQDCSTTGSFADRKEKEPDKDQEILIYGKNKLGRSLLGPCLSTEATRQIERIKLSENQHQDRGLQIENTTNDRRDYLQGTLV